ncbi:hypothetical protein PG985_004976 [Apiospora marii]|uniref:Uncharacterized protein n=1 Tax=Apiospora marii TaxID=335849 RepID=A0ABR1SAJ6_9PEZI
MLIASGFAPSSSAAASNEPGCKAGPQWLASETYTPGRFIGQTLVCLLKYMVLTLTSRKPVLTADRARRVPAGILEAPRALRNGRLGDENEVGCAARVDLRAVGWLEWAELRDEAPHAHAM